MLLDATTMQALAIVGGVGGVAGLVAGFFASADNLFGAVLMGIIGGISLSAILRIAGAPPLYGVGDGFSIVYAGAGGLLLGFVVGKSNT